MSGNWHKRGNLRGANGVGVPEGGQPGQMLQKVGSSDYATGWAFPEYKDIQGKVPKSALPDIGNSTQVVDSESAMLNLPAVAGNMVIRTDLGKTFVLAEEPANVLENWVELVTSSDVQSVNGKTGNVTLTKADVGLSKVNNTADADKPVATTSVNGLMSKTDKAALNGATYQATANALVKRTSTGSASFSQLAISEAPTASGHVATKSYTDDLFGTLAGGSVLSDTDWNAMRTTASTGVVEGWVKGCPIGGKLVGNMSAGFVIDPVWKLEVRPEGLNYVTQRATLLNCTPKFMVGFMWERIYNPAQAKWSAWACVGGDSGPLTGQVGGLLENASVEAPFRSVQNSSVYLYNNSDPLTAQRIGGEVRFWGAMTSTKLNDMTSTSTATNPTLAYFSDYDYRADPNKPGADYTLGPSSYRLQFPVQSGSYRNHWLMGPANKDGVKWAFVASRYGPNVASNPPWLPFNITWPVPAINTYTGPGFVPPILDAQSGTGPS